MATTGGERLGRTFEILVRGTLDEALADELGATALVPRRRQTLIVIEIIDQSHLHGTLERLRDLDIVIESVNPVVA